MNTPPPSSGSAPASPAAAGKSETAERAPVVRPLVAGLPAVAAGCAIAAFLWLASAGRPLVDPYEKEGKTKVLRKDFAGALVCYERLMRLAPDRADFRFVSAIVLEQLGKPERAEALIRSVAPNNRAGYPPAHLWMAKRLLDLLGN